MEIDATDAHFYSRKASFRSETLQFSRGGSLPRSGESSGDFVAYELSERYADGTSVHANATAIPNAKRKTTTMIEHPAHLLQRDRFIWKEL